MKGINQALTKGFVILMFSAFIISCASIPELSVNYQLPPPSEQLKGKEVVFTFEDTRKERDILALGAKKDLRNFSGNISFSVARHNEPGFKIGVFEFPALMKSAFNRRLETLGLKLVPEQSPGAPELLIVLSEFTLDFVSRKWVVEMNYEASLRKNGKVLSKQTIGGKAERLKLIGLREADSVLGEIFTDLINRLDVVRLFQQGGLLVP